MSFIEKANKDIPAAYPWMASLLNVLEAWRRD